jgi:hypothetical protein
VCRRHRGAAGRPTRPDTAALVARLPLADVGYVGTDLLQCLVGGQGAAVGHPPETRLLAGDTTAPCARTILGAIAPNVALLVRGPSLPLNPARPVE